MTLTLQLQVLPSHCSHWPSCSHPPGHCTMGIFWEVIAARSLYTALCAFGIHGAIVTKKKFPKVQYLPGPLSEATHPCASWSAEGRAGTCEDQSSRGRPGQHLAVTPATWPTPPRTLPFPTSTSTSNLFSIVAEHQNYSTLSNGC